MWPAALVCPEVCSFIVGEPDFRRRMKKKKTFNLFPIYILEIYALLKMIMMTDK